MKDMTPCVQLLLIGIKSLLVLPGSVCMPPRPPLHLHQQIRRQILYKQYGNGDVDDASLLEDGDQSPPYLSQNRRSKSFRSSTAC